MSDIKVNNITSLDGKSGPEISGITEMNSTGAMSLPRGDTTYRGGRGRGIFVSGTTSSIPAATLVNTIDYVTIATLGNATDFGDSTETGQEQKGGCASSTRGVYHTTSSNVLEYITISSTGNAFDFGDILYARAGSTSIRQTQLCSNSIRGLITAGYPGLAGRTIEYITISTLGNAQSFGELSLNAFGPGGSVASSTRAVHFLARTPSSSNILEYSTISTLGDAKDFGDLVTGTSMRNCGSFSSPVRGVWGGGSGNDTIEYITISSLGDSIDFGNLAKSDNNRLSGASSSTRGLFGGGETSSPGTPTNVIDYITIATTGNAADFGDLSQARSGGSSLSDSHGGLG